MHYTPMASSHKPLFVFIYLSDTFFSSNVLGRCNLLYVHHSPYAVHMWPQHLDLGLQVLNKDWRRNVAVSSVHLWVRVTLECFIKQGRWPELLCGPSRSRRCRYAHTFESDSPGMVSSLSNPASPCVDSIASRSGMLIVIPPFDHSTPSGPPSIITMPPLVVSQLGLPQHPWSMAER
jgi:hypothetical protein